ncbi:prepilin peptidase [Leucobacter sp. USHLN153]|uniref:prepilin peptidase n=1 Tax=Leucobacter sp. USHLN153 TaxID=3081268 RepID=UPI003015E068
MDWAGAEALLEIAGLCAFGVWSVALSIVDVRTRRLPNRLLLLATVTTLPLLLASAGCAWATDADAAHAGGGAGSPGRLLDMFAVSVGLSALFFALWRWAPAGIGGGDVKLAPLFGAVVGFAGGWQAAFAGVLLAFAGAAVWGLAIRRLPGRGVRPPAFAPCACAAAWLVIWVF